MKMRFSTSFICLTFLLLLTATNLKAQQPTTQIVIKTSAVCEMCKKKIEKALKFKGVVKSELDLKTKLVTVTYDPEQTNPEKIKSAISNAGYDADDAKANPKAYKRLDNCCKKEKDHS